MIKVIDQNRNEHQLTDRLERMVIFLIENAGEVVKPVNAQLTFHCAGHSVSATISKSLEISKPGS
jgi:hypothetical protein